MKLENVFLKTKKNCFSFIKLCCWKKLIISCLTVSYKFPKHYVVLFREGRSTKNLNEIAFLEKNFKQTFNVFNQAGELVIGTKENPETFL